MGEYVKYKGQQVKLGTCEDLYYVTLPQLAAGISLMSAVVGNLTPHAYLDPANGFRYRFPFPNEDGKYDIGDYPDFNRGIPIMLLDSHAPNLIKYLRGENGDPDNNFDHYDKWLTVGRESSGYRINVKIPCPLSAKFRRSGIETSLSGASNVVLLEQQKQVDGEVWSIISCNYCEAKWRLNKPLAEELTACAMREGYARPDSANTGFWLEVANRIMAGYK